MRIKNGEQVRRRRQQRQYTQRDLAYLVKRSQSTIYLIESGRMTTISPDLATAIAARLDVPLEELFESPDDIVVSRVGHDSSSGSSVLLVSGGHGSGS